MPLLPAKRRWQFIWLLGLMLLAAVADMGSNYPVAKGNESAWHVYKNAEIIILDEATSALASMTESAVLDHIRELGGDIAVRIVAHLTSTLVECDLTFEIRNSKINEKTNILQVNDQ